MKQIPLNFSNRKNDGEESEESMEYIPD